MKKLSTFALTLLITGSIDSIRNLPATALFGSTLIFFFIFAAMFFLIPTALVSAELAANIGEGGIYRWFRLAFGEKLAILGIWLQWINVVVWFPTILSFIAGTSAYLIDPAIAQNKYFLVASILATFWTITFINLRGIHLSSKFTSFCTIAGLIIPMTLIIGLMGAWLVMGKPLQIHFTMANALPDFSHIDDWVALTAIILGFAGMELAAVHVNDVENPTKSYPRALFFSTVIILLTMILGSLAIAFVIPHDQISLINGTIQTFTYFFKTYHLGWMVPVLTLLLVVGSLGGIVNWVVSPVKGLSQAAAHGYLPAAFAKHNDKGAPQNLLLLQATLVSIFCLAFLFFPGVNGSYWFLTALSTQLYMFMYVMLFAAAIRLRFKHKYNNPVFTIPGKTTGTVLVSLAGLFGCIITIYVSFLPPTNIDVGSRLFYETMFACGMMAMIMPVLFCYRHKAKNLGGAEIKKGELAHDSI